MTSPTLLCAVADDGRAQDVVRTSQRLARLGGFAPHYVHVVHAPRATSYAYGGYVGDLTPTIPLPADELDDLEGAGLRRGARLLRELAVPEGKGFVTAGDPATELLRLAGRRDVALVVCGTRARGAIATAVLGSVSRRLVTAGDRPVLVARPGSDALAGDGPVVCGLEEPRQHAARVARVAADLARRLGRGLVLAHALVDESRRLALAAAPAPPRIIPTLADEEAPPALLRTVAAALEDGAGGDRDGAAETHVVGGAPALALDTLCEERDAALLVVGSRSRGPVRTAVGGSVSLELARVARRPVVIVPRA